jgi:hypothetical protein
MTIGDWTGVLLKFRNSYGTRWNIPLDKKVLNMIPPEER